MKGYLYSVSKSAFVLYGGAFSKTKITQPPNIEINVKVGIGDFDYMISAGKCKTLYGGRHTFRLNQETVFHISEKGEIHSTSNSIKYRGQYLKMVDHIVLNMKAYSQYRIILQEENFILQNS